MDFVASYAAGLQQHEEDDYDWMVQAPVFDTIREREAYRVCTTDPLRPGNFDGEGGDDPTGSYFAPHEVQMMDTKPRRDNLSDMCGGADGGADGGDGGDGGDAGETKSNTARSGHGVTTAAYNDADQGSTGFISGMSHMPAQGWRYFHDVGTKGVKIEAEIMVALWAILFSGPQRRALILAGTARSAAFGFR